MRAKISEAEIPESFLDKYHIDAQTEVEQKDFKAACVFCVRLIQVGTDDVFPICLCVGKYRFAHASCIKYQQKIRNIQTGDTLFACEICQIKSIHVRDLRSKVAVDWLMKMRPKFFDILYFVLYALGYFWFFCYAAKIIICLNAELAFLKFVGFYSPYLADLFFENLWFFRIARVLYQFSLGLFLCCDFYWAYVPDFIKLFIAFMIVQISWSYTKFFSHVLFFEIYLYIFFLIFQSPGSIELFTIQCRTYSVVKKYRKYAKFYTTSIFKLLTATLLKFLHESFNYTPLQILLIFGILLQIHAIIYFKYKKRIQEIMNNFNISPSIGK